MKMSYFEDTDTLYIEFKQAAGFETRELDENTLLEVDAAGNMLAITIEHASLVTDLNNIVLSGIAA